MPSPRVFEIDGRPIGPGAPCFVIAEAGVNHDGSLQRAFDLVDIAAAAGADAVKFQTYRTDDLVTPGAPKAAYQEARTGAGETQGAMLRRLELPPSAFLRLATRCRERGILFLSTPFDVSSADLLEGLGIPTFKVPSGELTNLPFLADLAARGRPLIVSTGMATLDEVAAAVDVIRASGDPPLALLHCVSDYPTDPADANLRAISTLAATFGVPAGWSDHTEGVEVALAAVALGASIVEKHFTLDRTLEGPDHAASLEPAELAALVSGVRRIEAALGHGRKEPARCEASVAAAARRSLVAARDLPEGTVLIEEHLQARRPGTGIPPASLQHVLGRVLLRPLRAGAILKEADLGTAPPVRVALSAAPTPPAPPRPAGG